MQNSQKVTFRKGEGWEETLARFICELVRQGVTFETEETCDETTIYLMGGY